jgi:hypothetical protein
MDPWREARAWAEKALTGAEPNETIFVLGLACGYHALAIRSLSKSQPVLVIERDAELVKAATELSPNLLDSETGVEVVVEDNWAKLIEHTSFRDRLCGIYRIVPHGASFQAEPEYFAAVERLLNGRDRLSFLLQLKTRPELAALLDPEAILAIQNEAISVKTLEKLFQPQAQGSRERRLWRVLEELVL